MYNYKTMTSIFTLSLLILYTIISTEACDPPQNYRSLEPRDVLGNMDLVILGSFLSQENTTETTNGRTDYILALNTEVDCILKNRNGVSVGRNIKITEIRGDGWDNIHTCGDDFYDIRFNTHVVIGITRHSYENGTSEFAFDGYNLQGPYYYSVGSNMIDVDKLMWVCGFLSPIAPPEGNCPTETIPQDLGCHVPLTPQTAGVGRSTVKSASMFVVVSLLSLVYAKAYI